MSICHNTTFYYLVAVNGIYPKIRGFKGGGDKGIHRISNGADAVIEGERVEIGDNHIILKEKPKKWKNVRFQGEEIKKGEKVLESGKEITPQVAGFLSIMGIKYVNVNR